VALLRHSLSGPMDGDTMSSLLFLNIYHFKQKHGKWTAVFEGCIPESQHHQVMPTSRFKDRPRSEMTMS
jgi:hypothetical protein